MYGDSGDFYLNKSDIKSTERVKVNSILQNKRKLDDVK